MTFVARLRFCLPVLLAVSLCCFSGCENSEDPPKETQTQEDPARLDEARTLLQKGLYQDAVDLLVAENSAEANYLTAIALISLKKPKSAEDYIQVALKASPEEPRYQAVNLRMRLYHGDLKAIDELIALQKANPTNTTVTFYTYYAYEAQRLVQITNRDFVNSEQNHAKAMKMLETAIATAAATPELQREMLSQALLHKQSEATQSLVKRLRQVAPDDPNLSVEIIQAQLIGGAEDKAVLEARNLFVKTNGHERAAVAFAQALAKSKASSEKDAEFSKLVKLFPGNPAVVSLYGVYLAQSGRMKQSMEMLHTHIQAITNPALKQPLMQSAISIPMDENNLEVAEAQLARYREALGDELLIMYFEGRLLFLKNDQAGAYLKFAAVVKASQGNLEKMSPLTQESLLWMKKILLDAQARLELMKTIEGAEEKPIQPAPETPSPEQEPMESPETPMPPLEKTTPEN